jgi:magnesium-transporting ATPase (P-type)
MWLTQIFTLLLIVQFIVVVLHDWFDIRGWTHGSQVQQVVGKHKLLIATLINAIFPGAAVALAIIFWGRSKPEFATDYWVTYCAVTIGSAILMWYVPYLAGTTERKRAVYASMYAGTRQVLPERNGNPRPNLMHVCLHTLFAINLALAVAVRLSGGLLRA